jgi:hypothetical protein
MLHYLERAYEDRNPTRSKPRGFHRWSTLATLQPRQATGTPRFAGPSLVGTRTTQSFSALKFLLVAGEGFEPIQEQVFDEETKRQFESLIPRLA